MLEKKRVLIPIVGRSSSGKTTLINELNKRGYKTIEEIARRVLIERKDNLVDEEEQLIRQKIIYSRQLNLENSSSDLVYLDRGLIDVLAYTRYFQVNNSFIDESLLFNRYPLVLELEKRPFVPDGVRIEKNEEEVDKIYSLVRKTYLEFGYFPILVPNFCENPYENASKRIDFILKELKKLKLQ